jgi:hypothetical protein
MKTYKIDNNFSSILFVFFIFTILVLYCIEEITYSEFKNIKYCLFILIPIVFFITVYYNSFYRKIALDKNSICLYKVFFRKKMQLYAIIKTEEPYIMTVDKIIYLYPKNKSFWHDLEISLHEYKEYNALFYDKTKIIYSRLLSIMTSLNEKYTINNKRNSGSAGGIIIKLYFLWIEYLFKFFERRSLYSGAKRIKKILEKYCSLYIQEMI